MDYTKEELKSFYNKVGFKNGWDFSKIRCLTEGEEWNFYEEVKKRGGKQLRLLDVGTGGGEKVLQIAQHFQNVVGIDISDGMINTAKKNLTSSDCNNVKFLVMDAEHLDFSDRVFDIVSCRHSDFNPSEIFRVLKNGGIFLTQQVSENDKLNIKQIFGRGQSYGVTDGTAKETYVQKLTEAGFLKIDAFENDATEYYERPEDIIFLLKHTPIIPNFGKESNDIEKLEEFIRANISTKGVKTNSKRYMLIAEK